MTNVNQTLRPGNLFGTPFGTTPESCHDMGLKPGFVIKARNNFFVVEAREPLTVDLFFSDSVVITVDGSNIVNGGADGAGLLKYGPNSVSAILGPSGGLTAGTITSTILSPDFDSGYIKFDDLEPAFGHLYHLVPCLPFQPKFVDYGSGEFLMGAAPTSTGLPSNGGTPIGFLAADGNSPVGMVSAKCYVKHPVGAPYGVLDEAPEGDSGSAAVGSILGVNGFVDSSISVVGAPNWAHGLWIEHGENNLPAFRMVNDSEEFILDGRLRLQGYKYSIAELSQSQLSDLQSRGKVTFSIINPQGIPTSSSLSGPFRG